MTTIFGLASLLFNRIVAVKVFALFACGGMVSLMLTHISSSRDFLRLRRKIEEHAIRRNRNAFTAFPIAAPTETPDWTFRVAFPHEVVYRGNGVFSRKLKFIIGVREIPIIFLESVIPIGTRGEPQD